MLFSIVLAMMLFVWSPAYGMEASFIFKEPTDGSLVPEGDVHVSASITVTEAIEVFRTSYPGARVCYELNGRHLTCVSTQEAHIAISDITEGFHTLRAQVMDVDGTSLGPSTVVRFECVKVPFLGALSSPSFGSTKILRPLCNLDNPYSGKGAFRFSTDWFSDNIPIWSELLEHFVGKEVHALELGAWEGRSGVWLLKNILTHPRSTLTSVDYWQGVIAADMALDKEGFSNEGALNKLLNPESVALFAAVGPDSYQEEAQIKATDSNLAEVGSDVMRRYLHNICSVPLHAWRKVSIMAGTTDESLLHLLSPTSPMGGAARSDASSSTDRREDTGNAIEKFDLVYVDASHLAADVLSDAVLAWKLLREGGLMIFDDYGWMRLTGSGTRLNEWERPKIAVDSMVRCFADELDRIDLGYQYVLRKKPRSTSTSS